MIMHNDESQTADEDMIKRAIHLVATTLDEHKIGKLEGAIAMQVLLDQLSGEGITVMVNRNKGKESLQ